MTSLARPSRLFWIVYICASVISVGVAGLYGLAYWYLRQPHYLALALFNTLTLTAYPIAGWLARVRQRPDQAVWVIAFTQMLDLIAPPIYVADYWPFGLAVLFLVPIELGLTGHLRRIPLLIVMTILSAALIMGLELPDWPQRLVLFPAWSGALLEIEFVLAAFAILLTLLAWRGHFHEIRFDLATQLSLILTIVATSAILIVVSVLILQTRQTQVQSIGQNFQSIAEVNGERIGNRIEQQINALSLLSQQTALVVQLSETNAQYPTAGAEVTARLRDRELAWRNASDTSQLVRSFRNNPASAELTKFSAAEREHSELLLTDRYGGLVGMLGRAENFSYRDQRWWQRAWNDGLGDIYLEQAQPDPATQEARLLIALAVTDQHTNQTIGVLASVYSLNGLRDIMGNFQMADEGHLNLLTTTGSVIAASHPTQAGATAWETLLNPVNGKNLPPTWALSTNGEGRPVIVAYAPLNTSSHEFLEPLHQLNWYVVVDNLQANALRAVTYSTKLAVFSSLVVLALVAGVALGVARAITRPIGALTVTAAAIASGDLNKQAQPDGPSELVTLAEAFNTLTSRLRALINSLQEQVAHRTAQLQASADVGRAASSVLDPNALVRQTVNLISDRFGFYYAAVFLLDDTQTHMVLKEATGEVGQTLKERGHQLIVGGQSMVGMVAVTHKPRIALDVGQEAVRFANPLLVATRSEIALPLVAGGHLLGVLDVQSTQEAAFDENSAAVLQGMADQLAIALQNARLFEAANQRANELDTVLQASLSLTSRLELTEVLDSIVKSAFRLIPDGAGIHIFLYDEEADLLTFGASLLAPDETSSTFLAPRPQGITYTVARQGELIAVEDTTTHPLFTSAEPGSPYRWEGAIIGLPLKIGQRVVGVMNVSYNQPQRFSETELRVLRLLGDQAAIAIENARLFSTERAARDEAQTLQHATRALAVTLDLGQVLETILGELQKVVPYDSSSVLELKGAQLEIIASRGFEGLRPVIGITFGVHDETTPAQRVARTRAPYILKDAPEVYAIFQSEVHAQAHIRSWLGVPLLLGDRLTGMISLDKHEPNHYTEHHAQLAMTFATQAAIAIENARLFEETQRARQVAEEARQTAEAASRAKSTFLANMSHELRTPLNAIIGYSDLLYEDALENGQDQAVVDLKRIHDAGQHLLALISDILDISKIEAGKIELETFHFNLAECVKTSAGLVMPRAQEKNLDLTYSIAPDLPSGFVGDAIRIRQVLVNLLGNAVKFTDQGHITLTVTGRPVNTQQHELCFTIQDTGLGIPPDRIPHLFQPFTQVDASTTRRFGGTGLGLAISKHLSEMMGGRLTAESSGVINEGSTFSFTVVVNLA